MMAVIMNKIRNPNYRLIELISIIIDYSFAPVISILIGFLAIQKIKSIILFTIIPILSNTILTLTSIYTGLYFSITEDCQFIPGPFTIIFIIHILFIASTIFALFFHYSQSKDIRSKISAIFPYILILIGFILQMYLGLIITWGFVSIALCINYQLLRDLQYGFDALTKVRNRFLFHEQLEKIKKKSGFYLVILDINNLKTVNDSYGHIEGDHMISSVAQIISNNFMDRGTVYRIGGDEFCVISNEIPAVELKVIIKRIHREIQNIKTEAGKKISIACGYSIYNNNSSQTIYDCFNSADTMMYKNKMYMKKIDPNSVR